MIPVFSPGRSPGGRPVWPAGKNLSSVLREVGIFSPDLCTRRGAGQGPSVAAGVCPGAGWLSFREATSAHTPRGGLHGDSQDGTAGGRGVGRQWQRPWEGAFRPFFAHPQVSVWLSHPYLGVEPFQGSLWEERRPQGQVAKRVGLFILILSRSQLRSPPSPTANTAWGLLTVGQGLAPPAAASSFCAPSGALPVSPHACPAGGLCACFRAHRVSPAWRPCCGTALAPHQWPYRNETTLTTSTEPANPDSWPAMRWGGGGKVTPKGYVHVLTPRTCEGGFIGELGLCRYD